MTILQIIKRYRVSVAIMLVSYVLSYGFVRYAHLLIHRVSYADDVCHSVDMGDCGWMPLWYCVSIRISYISFSPLRWIEALIWQHFIPRQYEIH